MPSVSDPKDITMSEHSPTPWKLHRRAFASVYSGDDRGVANCGGYSTNTDRGEHIEENEANARHIVHCVNSYPALVEALQTIIDWADLALANPAEFDSHGVKNLDGPAFDAARAALTRTDAQGGR